MIDRIKRNWHIVALVAVAVLAFGAGRYATPTKVVTKTETVEHVVEYVVEKVVEVKAKAQVVYVDRVITKEGEVHERIVTKTVEREATKTDREADKEVKTDTKTAKTVISDAPRLTVMVLAGVDLSPAWQPITGAGPLALGVAVSYRIAGPLTVGVWGVHTGAFGVGLGAQF